MSGASPRFAQKVIRWQRVHGRHDLPWQQDRNPYRIWISEIMLQQTQVAAVVGYFERFIARFPDVAALASATEDEVLRLWSGLGYYARARNLHRAARSIVDTYPGAFPVKSSELELLPGIGRSTAAAIAVFSFGEPGAILDGNVKRVLARRFGIEGFPGDKKVESELWELATKLLPDGRKGIEAYTQGLMDLGATVCKRSNPECGKCPLSEDCIAKRTGRIGELPAPRPKKANPTKFATWLILDHRRTVLLERRPSSGLWGGLLVFPEFSGEGVDRHCQMHFGCAVSNKLAMPSFEHGFTHFRLRIAPLVCTVSTRAPTAGDTTGRVWMPIEDAVKAAVPVPVRKVLQAL